MRTDARLPLMLSCQRLWGSTLLAACLCHCYCLTAWLSACLPLPRPPYAVVMLPSLTELWPRKYKPCRSRSRSRIRSRTTPRPHTHPHRCLRPTRAAYPLAQLAAFLCRSSSLLLSSLCLLALPAISTGKFSGRRRK